MHEEGAKPEQLVIDSNYLVAVVDERDSLHAQAEQIDALLHRSKNQILYFDCVVTEAVGVLARRYQERKRSHEFGPVLMSLKRRTHDRITWVSPRIADVFDAVIELVAQSRGILNFNDGLVAVIMREQNLKYLLSFDQDFDSLSWITRVGTLQQLEALGHIQGSVGDV